MTEAEALRMIEEAVLPGGTWADLGAGSGTFTIALAKRLGPLAHVYAVERNRSALRELQIAVHAAAEAALQTQPLATVVCVNADFSEPLSTPPLDGVLMANALHFVPRIEQPSVLRQIAGNLVSSGRIVLVEYDRERGHQWVPYPIAARSLPALARDAGFTHTVFHERMPSAFGGDLYSASMLLTEE